MTHLSVEFINGVNSSEFAEELEKFVTENSARVTFKSDTGSYFEVSISEEKAQSFEEKLNERFIERSSIMVLVAHVPQIE